MIRQLAIIEGPVHKAPESSGAHCAVFIDPERVISAGDDEVLHLWSVVDGQELQSYNAGFDTRVLCLSPDRGLVAAAGGSLSGLALWDLKSGECRWRQEVEMYIGGLSFSADGESLFCKPLHSPAGVYRTEDGQELSRSSASNSVQAVCPMDSGLALCVKKKSLSLISLQDERQIWRRNDALEKDFFGDFQLIGRQSLGAVVAGEKQLLIVRAADGATALAELQFPGELKFKFKNLFAISDDGALLCALGSDTNLHLFSLPDGRHLATLEDGSINLTKALLFAPDNCRILALQGLDRPQVVFHFEWKEAVSEPDWQQLDWQEPAGDPQQ